MKSLVKGGIYQRIELCEGERAQTLNLGNLGLELQVPSLNLAFSV